MFEMPADRFAALQCLGSDPFELAAVMKLEKRDEAWEHRAHPSRDALDKFVRHP
jgi:hypothetical protein